MKPNPRSPTGAYHGKRALDRERIVHAALSRFCEADGKIAEEVLPLAARVASEASGATGHHWSAAECRVYARRARLVRVEGRHR